MNDKIIQNKIIIGLVDEFEREFGFPKQQESKSFEKLVSYVVLSKIDPEAFSDPAIFELIDVDKKSTFGIDAFALFVNDNLITDKDEIEAHRKSKRLEVRFVFIQTKRSTSADSGEILKFTKAVENLFSQTPSIPLTEELESAKLLIDEIFKPENARLFVNKRPRCELYYATSGGETKDEIITGLISSEETSLSKHIPEIQSTSIKHIGADFIIDAYSEISNQYSVLISFEKNIPCEKINDVEQAFIGYLPVSEFLKLITGSDGNIRKNIFYENVRDFQGLDNNVNLEIKETLTTEEMLDKFILLNNGVTVVARRFTNIRSTEYEVSDYYVVNGCQTSNMIFKTKADISESTKLKIPIKIIHTTSNDLIAQLIRSTNRQTPVPDEAFVSLEKFHKRLQEFYRTYGATVSESLYYERRSKEFTNQETSIERPRIVNLYSQIRSFISVILNEPQIVMSRNPSSILTEHRSKIFLDDHKYTPYYLSSLMLFLFNKLNLQGSIDGRYVISRYWICWIARALASKNLDIGQLNSSKTERECEAIIATLGNSTVAVDIFARAIALFETAKRSYISKNGKLRVGQLIRLKAFKDTVKSVLISEINQHSSPMDNSQMR